MSRKRRRAPNKASLDWITLVLLSGGLTGQLIEDAIGKITADIDANREDPRPRSLTVKLTVTPGQEKAVSVTSAVSWSVPNR